MYFPQNSVYVRTDEFTPKVKVYPRVQAAMQAFTQFQPNNEKGMLLLGSIHDTEVHVDDFIVFPQTGSSGAVDYDATHPLASKFWPAVHDYLTKNGKAIIGWSHYFSGGVHHSHTDHWQDDKFAMQHRDTAPIFISMTFNDKEYGAVGKAWANIGSKRICIDLPKVPVEMVLPESVKDDFLNTVLGKISVAVEFQIGKDGPRFSLPPSAIGLDPADIAARCKVDLEKDWDLYMAIKDGGLPQLLEKSVDGNVLLFAHKQLSEMWRPSSPIMGHGHIRKGGETDQRLVTELEWEELYNLGLTNIPPRSTMTTPAQPGLPTSALRHQMPPRDIPMSYTVLEGQMKARGCNKDTMTKLFAALDEVVSAAHSLDKMPSNKSARKTYKAAMERYTDLYRDTFKPAATPETHGA